MTTLTRYPQRVPKQRWTPPTQEIAELLGEVANEYAEIRRHDARFRELLAKAANEHAVPIAALAAAIVNPDTGKPIERKTVYRHLGRSMK